MSNLQPCHKRLETRNHGNPYHMFMPDQSEILYLQLNWSVIDVTELFANVWYERRCHYHIALWDIYAAVVSSVAYCNISPEIVCYSRTIGFILRFWTYSQNLTYCFSVLNSRLVWNFRRNLFQRNCIARQQLGSMFTSCQLMSFTYTATGNKLGPIWNVYVYTCEMVDTNEQHSFTRQHFVFE